MTDNLSKEKKKKSKEYDLADLIESFDNLPIDNHNIFDLRIKARLIVNCIDSDKKYYNKSELKQLVMDLNHAYELVRLCEN